MALLRRPFTLALALLAGFALAEDFTLTVLHTNDMHARIEGATIQRKQLGGYARQASLIAKARRDDPNVILLNAGDTFQGTLYFNQYEGLADLLLMNLMGYQAMTVGNHEFDRGPSTLAAFAKNARFPLLACNLDVSGEPLLKDWIKPSTVVEVGSQKVGVVGAVTDELFSISSPGPNLKLLPLVPSIQAQVDELTRQGINKIILLTHVGYDEDKALAQQIRGADLIVGGHSHTMLGSFGEAGLTGSQGKYPTVVERTDGSRTLVVQAWQWGLLLGRIQLTFDEAGVVKSYSSTPPIVIDSNVPEDPIVAGAISALQKPILAMRREIVGSTETGLKGGRDNYIRESPLGNVIADAMLDATRQAGAVAAFMNAGGIRASVEPGPISYETAYSIQPFNNTLVILDVTGQELLASLEHGTSGGGFLQVSSGFSYTVDYNQPAGKRVTQASVGGRPIEPAQTYRVTLNSFVASGGDAHNVFKEAKGKRTDTGLVDIDVLVDYLRKHQPLNPKLEGRIVAIGEPKG